MFILDLPDLRDTCEKVCFVNPSGLVELWVNKSRFIRYGDPNRLLRYLRRKLGDNTIHKIIPYETDSYSIIRHPLQDVNEFIEACDKYTRAEYQKSRIAVKYSFQCKQYHDNYYRELDQTTKCLNFAKIFVGEHIELFNSLDFAIGFCTKYPSMYSHIPDQFKCNKKLLKIIISRDQSQFQYTPDTIKNDRNFAIKLIKQIQPANNLIYRYLSHELRKDPEILSAIIHKLSKTDLDLQWTIGDIPDNLINNRDFILSLNIDASDRLYQYLSSSMQQDYDIISKIGEFYDVNTYARTIYAEMKSDFELHKILINRNANIFTFMCDELRDNAELANIFIDNIDNDIYDRLYIERFLSRRLLYDPSIRYKLSQLRRQK